MSIWRSIQLVSFRFDMFRFVLFRFVSICFVSFRSVSFRFDLFRFVSICFVSFRFVSVSFRTLQGPTIFVLKFIEIVIFGVYSPSLLASICFGTFVTSLFNFFSYFVWLRITDDGSVLEMGIWSILLSLFSYCKSQAFTLNTLWSFLQNICPKHIFRFSKGGGGVQL